MHILIVEDEAPLLSLLEEGLEDMGFAVTTACHGVEALTMLERETKYDVVFSDISMPLGVSGIDLALRVRELQPQARVLLASGLAKSQLPKLPDFVTFVQKPYRLLELAAQIKTGLKQDPSATH